MLSPCLAVPWVTRGFGRRSLLPRCRFDLREVAAYARHFAAILNPSHASGNGVGPGAPGDQRPPPFAQCYDRFFWRRSRARRAPCKSFTPLRQSDSFFASDDTQQAILPSSGHWSVSS
jgi:hypothetical protein